MTEATTSLTRAGLGVSTIPQTRRNTWLSTETVASEQSQVTQTTAAFQVGQAYSNEEIYLALGVGNAGGIRIRNEGTGVARRAALFTSASTPRQLTENPYKDRIEGDVLVYTGTGRSGDQNISGANARLQQQAVQGFPIYGFAQVSSRRTSTAGNKRWAFLGLFAH